MALPATCASTYSPFGDDDARIRRKLERERFVLPFAELKNHETGEVGDRFLAPRYVDTFEEEAEIDIDAVQEEIELLEKELVDVRARMAAMLKEVVR